jgi:putative intracellular protease/amidase
VEELDAVGPYLPAVEVFLHPGGWGTRASLEDAEYLDWIRSLRKSVPLITSVCTGSLVYAAAGLLAGRPPTTHRRRWTSSLRSTRRSTCRPATGASTMGT